VTLLPIKLTLAGGLGNQLFQLSAGIYLEEKLGRKVIYDFSNLTTQPKAEMGNYTRKFEIQDLVRDNESINTRYPLRVDYPVRFIRRLLNPDSVIIETDPNFDALERVNGKTTAIYGYFQRASIVNEAWPTLKSKLEKSAKFAPLINSEKIDRIAIHIRFGDYSDDPRTKSVHGLTSTKYFEQAINFVRSNENRHTPILVVTDDQAQAADFISPFSDSSTIDIISNPNPIYDLTEICRSSHVVITNSTFSWWGGWIANKVHNSSITYPRPWFADISDPELPIYVNGWTGMKREFAKN
jgi:hypothetical protein